MEGKKCMRFLLWQFFWTHNMATVHCKTHLILIRSIKHCLKANISLLNHFALRGKVLLGSVRSILNFIWGFLLNCQGSKVKFSCSKTWYFSDKDEYNLFLCHFTFSVLIVVMTLTKNITFFFTNTRLNLSHYQSWLQLVICLSFYYMNTSSSWCLSEKRSSHCQDTKL